MRKRLSCCVAPLSYVGHEALRQELEDFRARHAYWIDDWERFAAPDAAADQVRFEREWLALRRYAASRGVRLIGDLPIYVAAESAETRAHPELFEPGVVAGAAPDVSHPEGQLWGQPVYCWREMRRQGFRWWVKRFRRSLELFDLRIGWSGPVPQIIIFHVLAPLPAARATFSSRGTG